jgi:hypothetical protein
MDLSSTEDVEEIAMHAEAVEPMAEEPPGMFDNVTDDPNAPPDPDLHFRHTDMPKIHAQPWISEHPTQVESEAEEREASEIDLLPPAEEPEEEEQIIALDEGEVAEALDVESIEEVEAIDLDLNDLDPEGTLAFGEESPAPPPPFAEPEPPVQEPKKNDGAPNFDFLK